MIHYLLTIDKCKTDCIPLVQDYAEVFKYLVNKVPFVFTKIQCYEFKHKSKKFPKWLHFHGIIQTKYFRLGDFKKVRYKGFHINVKYLSRKKDIIQATRYINKDKVDISHIHYKQYEESKEYSLSVTEVQSVLDHI